MINLKQQKNKWQLYINSIYNKLKEIESLTETEENVEELSQIRIYYGYSIALCKENVAIFNNLISLQKSNQLDDDYLAGQLARVKANINTIKEKSSDYMKNLINKYLKNNTNSIN